MDSEVRAALKELRDAVVKEMREGFSGVHIRQDTTNGRINKLELEQARQDERLKNTQREVFNRRRSDNQGESESNGEGDGHSRGGDRRVSERDVRMVIAGGTGSVAVLMFFWKVFPIFLRAVTP